MTLITVLIVLATEFYFRWGAEYRQFGWFEYLQVKMMDLLGDQPFYEGGFGLACILVTPILIMAAIIHAFPGPLYYLTLFIISLVVLFYSLGPIPIRQSYASYFDAMERGDSEAGFLLLRENGLLKNIPESDEVVRNATRSILVESQSRYFGVIFWFIFLGPYGALFYRLCHQYASICQREEYDEHLVLLERLIHIIDWIPSRLTSCLFLLTGDFVNGFYRVKDYFFDFGADNRDLISETGIAALDLDMHSSNDELKENRDALAMIDRTIIIYLVVVAALTPLAFW